MGLTERERLEQLAASMEQYDPDAYWTVTEGPVGRYRRLGLVKRRREMTRIGPMPEVVVIRSGYASDALYDAAIRSALSHGREVRAIDAAGKVTMLPEPEPEVPEW